MKGKFLFSVLIILTLAACGPEPEPTVSPSDLASTAIAMAWTEVYMTQAALPTATSIPPTPTLLPAFTPLPTLPVLVVPTSIPPTLPSIATSNSCDAPPPYEPKGTMVQVKFVNRSDGSVNLAFGMIEPNSLGECGTYSFSIGRYDEPVVTVLAGCYWAYGWVTGDTPSTANNIDALCITDPNHVPAITIGKEVIGFN